MKKLVLASALGLSTLGAMAQLPPNSVAPDFTTNDINGNSHHLYAMLDSGYTVVLDIYAAWCGPCWNYHNSHALENLYTTYGPGTSYNKVRVMSIEGEATNTLAQIQGSSTGNTYATFSQGDWTAGTPYPMIDNATIATSYAITYFPTIYMICPNRIVNEVGQITTAQLWTAAQACPAAVTGTNAALLTYNGQTVVCDQLTASVTLQNMGTNTLSTCNLAVKEGNTTLTTHTWNGSLAEYATADVTFSAVNVTNPANVHIDITTTDANSSDNTLNPGLVGAPAAMANLTFNLTLDYYCAETTWKLLKNSDNSVVESGGPYNCTASAGGPDANTTKSYQWTVPQDCYRMEVYDQFGDGMASMIYNPPHPDGSFELKDGHGTMLFNSSAYTNCNFGTVAKGGVHVNQPAGIEENELSNSLNIFPNPTNGTVFLNYNLRTGAHVMINIYNALGELVMNSNTEVPSGMQSKQMDLSDLRNGVYYMNIVADGMKASRAITVAR